jgi:hypothetical protein
VQLRATCTLAPPLANALISPPRRRVFAPFQIWDVPGTKDLRLSTEELKKFAAVIWVVDAINVSLAVAVGRRFGPPAH